MKLTEEDDNRVCITTRYVVDDNSPIVYVAYDEDGDWQFFGADQIEESDAVVWSVKQIRAHDSTLKNLPDLQKGQSAVRDNVNGLWRIES